MLYAWDLHEKSLLGRYKNKKANVLLAISINRGPNFDIIYMLNMIQHDVGSKDELV